VERRTVTLCVDRDGFKVCEPIEVTSIPGQGYRLEQTPVGANLFQQVVEQSALRHWFWLASPSVLDSARCAAFLDRVLAAEGGWERNSGASSSFISHRTPGSTPRPRSS
jgi:hypothetical protein